MTTKELRQKFGVSKAPLLVAKDARVFVKNMPFDEEHSGKIETRSWIVITGGKLHRSNTYNGGLGKGGNPLASYNTEDAPADDKALTKKTKGYAEVELDECPFIAVEGAAATTAAAE